MIDLLFQKDELQVLGKLLRKERESGCYTGQEIARKIGLSKQIISDIETGSKNVSYEKVKIYADFFDIKLKNSKTSKFKKEFWENIKYLIYADYDSFTLYAKKIVCNTNDYINTCDAPLFYLLQMIYAIIQKEDNKMMESFNVIEEYFIDLFDSKELFMYYIYLGNYYADKSDWEKALFYYEETREKCAGVQEELKGMLYYGLGYIYWKLGNPINSLIIHKKAKNLFDSTNNYIRSLYTGCHIGMNLTHNKKVMDAVRLNMVENYFYKGDYLKAIELSNKCLEEGLYLMEMNDILMWSYHKLGNYEECIQALKRMKEIYKGQDEYYRLMICTMQAILSDDSTKIIQYLKLLYTFTETDKFYIVQDFILDLLIENLSKQKRYREAMDYSRLQMDLLRRKMSESRKS